MSFISNFHFTKMVGPRKSTRIAVLIQLIYQSIASAYESIGPWLPASNFTNYM